jgi:DNA-directed RNA polymerase specialized sigma24 family protein
MEQAKEEGQEKESFGKILSDKANNKKWLNYARKELRGHRNQGSARHKEAEDYVEDVKLKILSGEIVQSEENGNIDNFICGIIRNDIKVEFRKEPVMVTLRERDDHDDEGEGEEEGRGRNSCERTGADIDEKLIVGFDDPFEEKLMRVSSWELMQRCYKILENEEPEFLIIFDEKSKGHQNRDIAKYLCVDVREVENMWKRILRLLRKEVNGQFSL